MTLDFDTFLDVLAGELELERARITGDELLIDDLELDSFDLFRLVLLAEALLPGIELPIGVDVRQLRLRDVYSIIEAGLMERGRSEQ